MYIFHGENIISHFFIRMIFYQSLYYLGLQVGRVHNFNFGFFFMLPFANFSYIWISPFLSFKCAQTLAVEATFGVLTNMARTGIKNSVSYFFGLVDRSKSDKPS